MSTIKKSKNMSYAEDFVELLESFDTLPPEFAELVDFYKKGIPFDEWKAYCNKRKEKLEGSSGYMLEILENQWNSISYHDLEREKYYSLKDSPLEILDFCVADDFLTYPPPEILWVIARQFHWYMEHEGKFTLEEAFFGKPIKGKGTYAKRMADEKIKLYKNFHQKVKANSSLSQAHLLERLCTKTPAPFGEMGTKDTCSLIYAENQKREIDQDSFLRGYRRWKKAMKDK